jgi:hypothetical protein
MWRSRCSRQRTQPVVPDRAPRIATPVFHQRLHQNVAIGVRFREPRQTCRWAHSPLGPVRTELVSTYPPCEQIDKPPCACRSPRE